MKPRWVIALGLLVIAATIAWSRMEPDLPPAPAPEAVAAARPARAPEDERPAPPPPIPFGVPNPPEPIVAVVDAGSVRPPPPALIEVAIEVIENKGHASGLQLVLTHRTLDQRVDVTTNVMGYATVRLTEGSWDVRNPGLSPRLLNVSPASRTFVLKLDTLPEHQLGGIVLGAEGRPVSGARILDVTGLSAGERYWEHAPLVATTGFDGRFTLTSASALGLMAVHDDLQSLPQVVSSGTTDAVFHLFAPAWVRTSIVGARCQLAFVQFEHRDGLHEFPLIDADFERPVPAGLVKFRARCLDVRQLMYGYVEASLKPHAHERVVIGLEEDDGLMVLTWDVPRNRAVGGLTLTAGLGRLADAGVSSARAITNNAGSAFLTPDVLTSYAPVFAIEATGTMTGATKARLGDRPVKLPVFPRSWDAARRAAYVAAFDGGF